MKRLNYFVFLAAIVFSAGSTVRSQDRYVSSKTHIKFFSTTPVEDIEANNYASVSTLNKATGDVVFSVPMQSFEFEKALMQQHFNNEHFLETSVYPKAKMTATITDLEAIDFTVDGEYPATIEGEMTIKDKTNPFRESGTIKVKDGQLTVNSTFDLTLADYGIVFNESEMVSTKIAKTIQITVVAEYTADKNQTIP